MVYWFGLQNQAGFGLLVAPQNRRDDTRRDLVTYFAWKQVWLVFSSLASRLEARQRVMYMAPSQRLRRNQVEDGRVDVTGCVGSCYPCCAIFILLGTRGSVVI
jgi:hypothetical protein